jgi:hypothetical protein
MTDKTICLNVALDKEKKCDEIEDIINAIKMIKGVSGITSTVFDSSSQMNAWAYKQKWLSNVAMKFIDEILEEKKTC